MLHLKDGVLAEVDKTLELLLVAALGDGGVEEGPLGLLDLRLLPLLDVVLVDLEVDALDLVGGLDLDPAEEGLEVVEDGAGLFEELGQPWVIGHVLGKVGEQDGQVEADLLGGVEEAAGELVVVDVPLVVCVAAQEEELYLITEGKTYVGLEPLPLRN